MTLSKSPYRGTRDFFPKEKRQRDHLFNKMSQTAELFGYEPYDGPLLEEVDLYLAKSGEELINEQIYSFIDRGERKVAIRPEMTPTLARMIAQIHREVAKPIRWYAIPNLMRYEKPQRGRLREHWQFNCDIFGATPGVGEAEILSVLVELFQSLGAGPQHFQVLLNDRRIVDALFTDKMRLSQEVIYKLYKIIDKSKKVGAEATEKMVDALNLTNEQKTLFHRYLNCQSFDDILALIKECQLETVAHEFESFLKLIPDFGLESYLVYDPTIVRGLDYYTGIVFEAFDLHPDNRRALCGGGAYSSLLKIFNEEAVPGVGFGLGDVTLTDFLQTHGLLPDFTHPKNHLFLTCQDPNGLPQIMKLARELRHSHLKVVTGLEPLKFKKVFNLAEKNGSLAVGLIGTQEIDQKSVQMKNLKTGEQTHFPLQDVAAISSYLKKLED